MVVTAWRWAGFREERSKESGGVYPFPPTALLSFRDPMAASPVRASRPPPERPSTALLDQQALEARQQVVALGKREFLEQLSSLGRAFAADPGNPGSYACTDCERCANCMFCKECAGCYQCTHCIRCEGCSNCSHCVESKSLPVLGLSAPVRRLHPLAPIW